MKQSLQLRIGQQLTMTPQLQQAIRLLQLSSLELEAEIQEALESNPLLERVDEAEDNEAGAEGNGEAAPVAEAEAPVTEAETVGAEAELADESVPEGGLQSDDIPADLPVDSAWEDVFDAGGYASAPPPDEDLPSFENRRYEEEDLRDHLLWQLHLTPFSETDQAIALAIIDAIDEDGYLRADLEEIREALDEDVELEEIEAVLHRIQNFDPPGVGARDLRESLILQLRQWDPETPWYDEAMRLLEHYFDLLAGRDFNQLARRLRLSTEELTEVVRLINKLNPRPGAQISPARTEYVVPDVIVRKVNGKWRVELNPETQPKLRINSLYASMVKRASRSADNAYLQGRLQEARWFIKSLQSRNETLLKVATCIVERQQAFLEHGEEAMKALVLHDIAEAVGMHESTISRITTKKYMHTPRGIFELKYFFSSHVSTDSGGECSSTAIRAIIKKMIANEDVRKPLSDSKIAALLAQQGIKVARRTVAKYRDSLGIPPSNERKRLA